MRLVLVAAALFLGLAGCSQARSVTARPDLYEGPYRTAYLVVKPDQGKDMQQHFERALQARAWLWSPGPRTPRPSRST
jgi:hypothetical protein